MMANIKLKNGSEYPNCFVYGITKFSLNAKIQFGNGRKCLSKSDIEEMDIKTYWDLDKMEQLKEFNYPARQFKKYEILENLSYNAKTEETLELEKKLEEIAISEREIAKGSCPLKLDHIEFGDYSYQEITSKEKLLEVLSYLLRIGDFKQYAGKTILNNVYMDLRGKKSVFKRTKTAVERNNIFATIRRYAKKLKPQYNGDVYLETVR